MTKMGSFVLVLALAFGAQEAMAKRMGGGMSFGKKSNNVTQRQAAPPTAPAQNSGAAAPAQNANAASRPAAAPQAAAPKRPMGAMLGGLAAGLGLAWLASSLGLGEAFGQILMMVLFGVLALAVMGWFMRRRQAAGSQGGGSSGLAYQGAGPAGQAHVPRGYSEKNVGNDASARPWESTGTAFQSVPTASAAPTANAGSMIGAALAGSQSWGVPADFDVDGFLQASKRNFIGLQDAWDRSDIPSLRAMMTDAMLVEIKGQLAEREQSHPGVANKTEVEMLEAQLLGIEELDGDYMASVEFSGLIREDASSGATPFREVWNITKSKRGGGGWLVAGVQALD